MAGQRDSNVGVSLDFQNQTQPQSSPFSCNLCGRSYTRLDHLARHFRSRKQFISIPEWTLIDDQTLKRSLSRVRGVIKVLPEREFDGCVGLELS